MNSKRIIISIVLFIVATIHFQLSGSHKCDEGSPPEFLSFIAGVVTATIPWLFTRWKWTRRIVIVVMLIACGAVSSILAHSYHGQYITGNPEFSSGRFWHTALSGQYPRDRYKTDEFKRNSIARMKALEIQESERSIQRRVTL
jgi:hypothetical protein